MKNKLYLNKVKLNLFIMKKKVKMINIVYL